VRAFFDDMMELGIEGMMLSPGYSYEKAPDQQHFLGRAAPGDCSVPFFPIARRPGVSISRHCLWNSSWANGTTPALPGECRPINIFGWQKPCYLLQDGYADTFDELIRETPWESYGPSSGNPHCANCMVHSGYEASAVNDTFGSLSGFVATVKGTLFHRYRDEGALRLLDEPAGAGSASAVGTDCERRRKPLRRLGRDRKGSRNTFRTNRKRMILHRLPWRQTR